MMIREPERAGFFQRRFRDGDSWCCNECDQRVARLTDANIDQLLQAHKCQKSQAKSVVLHRTFRSGRQLGYGRHDGIYFVFTRQSAADTWARHFGPYAQWSQAADWIDAIPETGARSPRLATEEMNSDAYEDPT